MKEIVIKPGSIILWKKTGWFSKITRFFSRKKGYKYANVYDTKYTLVSVFDDFKSDEDIVILEPRKQYTKAEIKKLRELYVFSKHDTAVNVAATLNAIRPDTVDPVTFTLDSLLNNKYYKVIYDSTKKD